MTSYEQDTVEDRILDLIICLEALLLENEAELRYKISLRTALFLELYSTKRNQVFHLVNQGYGVRNKVGHGEEVGKIKINNKEISLQDLVKELEQICRLSITKFIEKEIDNKRKRQKLLQNLDDKIFLN